MNNILRLLSILIILLIAASGGVFFIFIAVIFLILLLTLNWIMANKSVNSKDDQRLLFASTSIVLPLVVVIITFILFWHPFLDRGIFLWNYILVKLASFWGTSGPLLLLISLIFGILGLKSARRKYALWGIAISIISLLILEIGFGFAELLSHIP